MKLIFVFLAVVAIIGTGFVLNSKPVKKLGPENSIENQTSSSSMVILELFTSEGCSSCPSADKLLPEFAKDPNVIPLSFHVDYWNSLGWTDPFSSSEYSDRQRDYVNKLNLESAYTPQLIVNGEYEMVGSSFREAENAIEKASLERQSAEIKIGDLKTEKNKLLIQCTLTGDFKSSAIVAALVQNEAMMKVTRGENEGRTLTHINIVRTFEKQKAETENKIELSLPENYSESKWKLVMFVQRNKDFKIIGATNYQL